MAPNFAKFHPSPILVSAAHFAAVGLLGTLIDFSLFSAARMLLALPVLLANSLSYSAGILNNFYLNRKWTFAQRSRKPAGRQFAQFALVSLTALAFNTLVMALLLPPLAARLGDPSLAALLAKIAATAAGLAWNFGANHLWTFSARA